MKNTAAHHRARNVLTAICWIVGQLALLAGSADVLSPTTTSSLSGATPEKSTGADLVVERAQGAAPVPQPSASFVFSDFSSTLLGGTPEADTIVCTCMCCLQGACVPVANATWTVPSCGLCSQADCVQRAADLDALWSSETSRRRVSRSACFVLHTTEQKTCSGMSDRQCRRFTTIRPHCVQRSSALQTLCCLGWTVAVALLIASRLWIKYRRR